MSVSTFAALLAEINFPSQIGRYCKSAQIATGTGWNSEWISTGLPVAATAPGTTAATCDRTTTGALGQGNKAGAEQRAILRRYGEGTSGTAVGGMFMLVDRLAQVGGLSGTTITAQTVSTPALTRFTSGAGVWAAAEIYTAVGATGTTITASYTNTTPTAGQLTQPVIFGGAGFSNARRLLPLSLAAGDVGITAVSTCTVLATTGTVGNFGITLFKTLGIWPTNATWPFSNTMNPMGNMLPMSAIPDNACLQLLHFGAGQVGSTLTAEIGFFED